MCMGGGGGGSPAPVEQKFEVQPVPPNVIDPEDASNFPNAVKPKASPKVPTNVKTDAGTGLQIK